MMNFFSLFLNDSPDVIDDDTRHPACDLRHAREKRRYEVSQSASLSPGMSTRRHACSRYMPHTSCRKKNSSRGSMSLWLLLSLGVEVAVIGAA